ncbi:MAG: glycosyltransferase family 4 protein [Anaerolineales bacterium]|nr:glycosyltransferase family 4 protein [Anaerolineales bacterium]
MPSPLTRVCIVPQVSGVGGMVSFHAKFSAGLAARGIAVTGDLADETCQAVLVIGGSRQLVALRRAARRGIPVVQRLDGMNWLHRRTRTGPRHWLRAEAANLLLAYIRDRVATRVVYQSHFVQGWWNEQYGESPAAHSVAYNGVDLAAFSPRGAEKPPSDHVRILMLEGNLQGGYELGLQSAVALAAGLQAALGRPVRLAVAGQTSEALRLKWNGGDAHIDWLGVVPNAEVPTLCRGAHLLYSADINAACPNAVIEALACGLPVLAFDTGALKEMVPDSAGRVVAYGGDPWRLDPPDTGGLTRAAQEILAAQKSLRSGARRQAEAAFGLDAMVDAYIEALSG